MGAAALLKTIYQAYRDKRIDEVMTHLDDSFCYVVHLPETALSGGDKPRNKAETAELFRHFMDTYDFLALEPGPIIATGDQATVHAHIRFRHKQTGKELDTRVTQTWRIKDGKAISLDEKHDVAKVEAFMQGLAENGA